MLGVGGGGVGNEYFFFFKQKTAYEIKECDWSSDVCSSDLLTEIFQKRLIIDRNQRMVERMHKRLEEGNAFIAVGALHLPGEKGILRLLEHRGYRVRSIY